MLSGKENASAEAARSARRYATRSLDSLPDPRASNEQLRRGFMNSAIASCNHFRANARGGRAAASIERMRREVFDPEACARSRAATAELSLPLAPPAAAAPRSVSFAALPTKAPAASPAVPAKLPLAGRGLHSASRPPGSAAHAQRRRSFDYGELASERNARSRELDAAGRGAVAQLTEAMACEAGVVFLVDEGGALGAGGAKGPRFSVFVNGELFSTPIDAGLAGACARAGSVVRVDDVAADARFDRELDALTGLRTRCAICAPVRARLGGQTLAVIAMVNKHAANGEPAPFGDADVGSIERGCDQLAPLIQERARLLTEATGSLRSAARERGPPATHKAAMTAIKTACIKAA